jgi:hypothetical protein
MQSEVFSWWNFETVGYERFPKAVKVMYGIFVLSASVSMADLVTLKFQGNKHPPLATSPHPVGSTGNPGNSSTGQNPCTALRLAYTALG